MAPESDGEHDIARHDGAAAIAITLLSAVLVVFLITRII